MSIQELEQQLLSLDRATRLHLSQLLTQSLQPAAPSLSDLPIGSNVSAWNEALQQLQRPAHPTALADLLQSWEDDSEEEEQHETWELLQQVLN
ncbi:MAG: hypothetical protein VKJ24_01795 [Synechococcales bacterium]|nr:hypothetical protein [Synechococcales bacterium]